MVEADKYREYAAECLRMAGAKQGADRSRLFEMAEEWLLLADREEPHGKPQDADLVPIELVVPGR